MEIPGTGVMRVLYNQHAAALRCYACRLTGDATRAEDVVQQTLLRAWQHPQMVDGHKVESDGLTWELTLRDGLRFHDGEKVLARDCVHSLEIALGSNGKPGFENIDAEVH